MEDIKQLKSVLRSLVVSSPVQVTLSSLMRDYRNMMGSHLPVHKYGYRDPLQFLKERCGDCFLFHGTGTNTVLTPIVPECLKHIDQFVQKQKVVSKFKCKGKRRSVQEAVLQPAPDLVAKSFEMRMRAHREYEASTPPPRLDPPRARPDPPAPPAPKQTTTYYNNQSNKSLEAHVDRNHNHNENKEYSAPSREAYSNFVKKRLLQYQSSQEISDKASYKDSDSGKCTSESEQRTLSSGSSSKALQLEWLREELLQLIAAAPGGGVPCTDLMKLYRSRYGRELNFSRFGFTSVSALACSLDGVAAARDATGELLLTAAPAPTHSPARAPAHSPAPAPRARPHRHASLASVHTAEHSAGDEDALPWIDFDPDVFPADCMSFSESIPTVRLESEGIRAGDMLELMVGEVYSPSHFWFYRLGEQHHIAMEDMMDEMTKYYNEEGANRWLAAGAVRVGHYCSSLYERDWHRSLIVQIVDSETVKVRHVDYGTVDRVGVSGLKPLLRRWARLPAQAIRARLAGARPSGCGRRWPHAACAAFLRLLQDRRLVGNVVALDREENIVELFLVDTQTERDVRIDLELIRAGHADPRPDPHPSTAAPAVVAESYLYPRFDALESGATPNYADIHAYLRDGIALEYVEEYSRHVPPALPPAPAPTAPAPTAPAPAPAPAARFDNRVPLIPRSLVDVSTAVVTPVERTPTPHSPPSPPSPSPEPDSLESLLDFPVPDSASSPRPEPVEEAPHAYDTLVDLSEELSHANLSAESDDPPQRVEPPPPPARPPSPPRAQVSKPPKPACRAAPQPRPLLGAPLFAPPPFPSPAMPFFVFSPPQPPFPSFPVQPAYPPPPPPRFYPPPPAPAPARPVYSCAPLLPTPPAPAPAPAPPAGSRRVSTGQGEVTLTVSECEIFTLLSSVDPHAAHWYIVDAISRARAAATSTTSVATAPRLSPAPAPAPSSRLNPHASEFSLNRPRSHNPPEFRPPPGF